MKVLVVYGKTESSDDLPVLVFATEPSKDEINAQYKQLCPEEFDEVDGPGCVYWQTELVEVQGLKNG